MKQRRFFILGVMLLCFILSGMGADVDAKEKFPVKPIQVIVGYQPGDSDNLLRPFIEKMPEFLGQPMVFQYKPGATGAIGAAFVAGSKPDGHTLFATTIAPITIAPHTRSDTGYTLDSFNFVCTLVQVFAAIVTQSNAPWKDYKEFVADAKKSPPGKYTYTTPGSLSQPNILMEALSLESGIKLTHIPSQGSGPATTAALGGHVNLALMSLAPAYPHVVAGTLKPLVAMGDVRIPTLPDLPTTVEMGFKTSSWGYYGLAAPKGTPREVVEALHNAAVKVMEKYGPTINERELKLGSLPIIKGPDEYTELLKKQSAEYAAVIKMLSQK